MRNFCSHYNCYEQQKLFSAEAIHRIFISNELYTISHFRHFNAQSMSKTTAILRETAKACMLIVSKLLSFCLPHKKAPIFGIRLKQFKKKTRTAAAEP